MDFTSRDHTKFSKQGARKIPSWPLQRVRKSNHCELTRASSKDLLSRGTPAIFHTLTTLPFPFLLGGGNKIEILVKTTSKGNKLSERLRCDYDVLECFSPPHLTTTPSGLPYHNRVLQRVRVGIRGVPQQAHMGDNVGMVRGEMSRCRELPPMQ